MPSPTAPRSSLATGNRKVPPPYKAPSEYPATAMITTGAKSSMNSTIGSLRSSRASLAMVSRIARSIAGPLDVVAQFAPGQRDERVGKIRAMHAEVEHVDLQAAQQLQHLRHL